MFFPYTITSFLLYPLALLVVPLDILFLASLSRVQSRVQKGARETCVCVHRTYIRAPKRGGEERVRAKKDLLPSVCALCVTVLDVRLSQFVFGCRRRRAK
jgi:hypothetical protein